jgi:hypothetical protein
VQPPVHERTVLQSDGTSPANRRTRTGIARRRCSQSVGICDATAPAWGRRKRPVVDGLLRRPALCSRGAMTCTWPAARRPCVGRRPGPCCSCSTGGGHPAVPLVSARRGGDLGGAWRRCLKPTLAVSPLRSPVTTTGTSRGTAPPLPWLSGGPRMNLGSPEPFLAYRAARGGESARRVRGR